MLAFVKFEVVLRVGICDSTWVGSYSTGVDAAVMRAAVVGGMHHILVLIIRHSLVL